MMMLSTAYGETALTELMTIQKAAQEVGVSPTTLRYYERLRLIAPCRDSANRRLYSVADVAEARSVAAQRRANRGSGLRQVKAAAAQ